MAVVTLLLLLHAGYVPASLLAVNAEVQRRMDAKQAATKANTPPALEHQESQRIPTPTPAEPPLSKDSYYSAIDTTDLPTDLHTSSSTDDLESQSSGPILVSELPAHRQPVGMTDAELSKLAVLKSEAQQAQQQPAGAQLPGATGAGKAPVNILAKADYTQKVAAAPGQGKQRRKSKREKAKGLLSSFTSSRKQGGRQQEDMDQALQMLSELRRTESTPNVEAEALKRNKGGGGPWMSFTRQRRPPKPRPATRGGASPRRGSPLATVVSGLAPTVPLSCHWPMHSSQCKVKVDSTKAHHNDTRCHVVPLRANTANMILLLLLFQRCVHLDGITHLPEVSRHYLLRLL